jgi:hypothetical protein
MCAAGATEGAKLLTGIADALPMPSPQADNPSVAARIMVRLFMIALLKWSSLMPRIALAS